MSRTIQILFASFALAMLVFFVYRVVTGTWTGLNWAMLAAAAIVCLLVFKHFLYVFTYSYALGAFGNAALILALRPSLAAGLIGGIALIYGLRMALFVRARNRSRSYAARIEAQAQVDRTTPFAVKLVVWHQCTWLLTYHLMALYVVAERGVLTSGVIAGALIMCAGLAIESVADAQKQRVKERDPDAIAMSGLYQRIRHANFLGEILVQLGLLTAGFSAAANFEELVLVSLAPVYLVILMVLEAGRLDDHQSERSGDSPEYAQWRAGSGSLLPGLGVRHQFSKRF